MTAPVSKVLSRGELLADTAIMVSHGNEHAQIRVRDSDAAMRAERAELVELIVELAQALKDEHYYAELADRTALLARAQALAPDGVGA